MIEQARENDDAVLAQNYLVIKEKFKIHIVARALGGLKADLKAFAAANDVSVVMLRKMQKTSSFKREIQAFTREQLSDQIKRTAPVNPAPRKRKRLSAPIR